MGARASGKGWAETVRHSEHGAYLLGELSVVLLLLLVEADVLQQQQLRRGKGCDRCSASCRGREFKVSAGHHASCRGTEARFMIKRIPRRSSWTSRPPQRGRQCSHRPSSRPGPAAGSGEPLRGSGGTCPRDHPWGDPANTNTVESSVRPRLASTVGQALPSPQCNQLRLMSNISFVSYETESSRRAPRLLQAFSIVRIRRTR